MTCLAGCAKHSQQLVVCCLRTLANKLSHQQRRSLNPLQLVCIKQQHLIPALNCTQAAVHAAEAVCCAVLSCTSCRTYV
jgi:hypothetical protein